MKRSLKLLMSALAALVVPAFGWADTLERAWTYSAESTEFTGFEDAKWCGDITITIALQATSATFEDKFFSLYNSNDATSRFSMTTNGGAFANNLAKYTSNSFNMNTGGHFTAARVGTNANSSDKAAYASLYKNGDTAYTTGLNIYTFAITGYDAGTNAYGSVAATFNFPANANGGEKETKTGTLKLFGDTGVYFAPDKVETGSNLVCVYVKIEGTQYVAPTETAATISENTSISAITWNPDIELTDNVDATLTANADAEVAMDEATTLHKLTIEEGSKITFKGEETLTSAITVLNADTDVSAITAKLGAVTLASGKTLNLTSPGTTLTTLAGGDSTSVVDWDVTTGLTPDTTLRTSICTFPGLITFTGSGENGVQMSTTTRNEGRALASRLVFAGGKHSFSYGMNGADLFATGGGDDEPVITVTGGTTLEFGLADLSGWNGAIQATPAVFLVGENATLDLTQVADGSGFFRNRILLDNGATIDVSATNENKFFSLYGGIPADATAQIALKAGTESAPKTAKITGNLVQYIGSTALSGGTADTLGSGIFVGEYATLTMESKTAGNGAFKKLGAGTLEYTVANIHTGTTTIGAGTILLTGNGTMGTGSVAVESGTALVYNTDSEATPTNTFTGAGTITADGCTLNLTDANLDGFTGTYEVMNGGTLILPAGKETAENVTLTNGNLILQLSTEQMGLGYEAKVDNVTFLNADGEEITEADGTVDGNTFTPALNTWTKGDDDNWATEGNWSKGTVPAEADSAAIEITEDTTITLANDVTVANLTVKGTGILTIAGEGKLVATNALVLGADITAPVEKITSCGSISIDEAKTLTLSSTTVVVDPDDFDSTSSISLPPMAGAGKIVKTGDGSLALWARAVEPSITLEGGDIHIREVPTTAFDITANAGTLISLSGWVCNYSNINNAINLKGDAELWLTNGSGLNGTITVSDAQTTPAKIRGMSFDAATINASITGSGMLEFAAGGKFGVDTNNTDKYPCKYTTTFAGVISGDLKVIVSDTDGGVAFTGTNTYTGGTEIAEGAKIIAETNAVGTGAISGEGTLQMPDYPSQETVRSSLSDGEKWTGRFVNTGNLTMADIGNWFGICGNENSEYELTGTSTGYLAQAGSCDTNVIITGSITFNNGWSSNGGYTFNGDLSGAGTIATVNDQTDVLKFLGETKDFAGTITVAGKHCIAFGEQADDDSMQGRLVVVAGKTANVAAGKTWTAVNGVVVAGTIGGTGTIGSTLTLADGATIDATAGALTVDGAVTLGTVTAKVASDADVGTEILTCSTEGLVLTKIAIEGVEGMVAAANTDGTAIVLAEAVVYTASANGVEYATIAEAVNAVKTATVKTVTIIADTDEAVTLPQGVTLAVSEGVNYSGAVTDEYGTAISLTDGAYTCPVYQAAITVGEKTTGYASLQAAVNAAQDGETINVLTMLTLTDTVTLNDAAKAITIDLNSGMHSSTAATAIQVTNGTLTLKTGAITASGVAVQLGTKNGNPVTTSKLVVAADASLASMNYALVGGEYVFDGDNVVLMYGNATLETAGSLTTYSTEWAAIQGSGGDLTADTTIKITDGKVTSENNHAIYHPQPGTLTITGGTVSGVTGIEMRAGTLAMEGGTVTATGEYVAPGANSNGSTVEGAAIVLSQHVTGENVTANITGGTITADNGKTFVVANTTGADPVDVEATIEADVEVNLTAAEILIPTVALKGNETDGYTLKTVVAQVGETKYETLQAAYEAATAEANTITLLGDTTGAGLVINKAITIDFNGYTYTVNHAVGSSSTQTLGMQINAATILTSTATAKGKLTCLPCDLSYDEATVEAVAGCGYTSEKPVRMLINNYADLTVTNVILDGSNLAPNKNDAAHYVLSNNSGDVTISATAEIKANDGDFAFDVCKYASHDAPTVTVADGAVIDGTVEVTGGTLDNQGDELEVVIASGTVKGEVTVDEASTYLVEVNGVYCSKAVDADGNDATDAAKVFTDIATEAADGVATVAWQFGISDITRDGDTVTITAKVTKADATTAAGFAESVKVTIYAEGTSLGDATVAAGGTATLTDVAVSAISGKKLTVKASK